MALQVWLPLTGDLRNYGIGNITSTSGTPSYKTPGKLSGSALDLKTRITFVCPALANLQTLSIAFWGYAGSSSTLTTNWQDLLGFQDVSSSGTTGTFRWETTYASTNGIHWHDNATNAFVNGSHTHISVKDTWCHCCVVFDYQKGKLYTYTNGVLVNTHNHLGGKFNTTGTFYVGETNNIEGMIQDVRIYDHALSDKEVEEISKGLVLHYKLDSGSSPDTILTTNTTRSATVAAGGTGVYTSYWYVDAQYKEAIQTNTILTVEYDYSVDMSTVTATTTYLYSQFNTTTISPQNPVTYTMLQAASSGHKVDTFVVTSSQAAYANSFRLRIRLYQTNEGANFTISNIKMYFGQPSDYNIVYDCSGNGYNGTVINNVIINNDTPKYNNCINLTTTSSHIGINNLNVTGFTNSFSIVWWGKVSTYSGKMMWGFANGNRLNGIYNGNLWNTGDGTNNPIYQPGTTTQVSAPSVNTWHHFVMTGNGTINYIYKDGELWGQSKTYKPLNGTSIYFNGWANSTSYALANTMLSDFRIYATVLTEAQIKELYNTSVSIDNKHNIHTRELVEI